MAEWDNNNSLNNQDDYLDTDNDKIQDSSNADAAKFNADEQERAINDRLSSEVDTDDLLDAGNGKVINADNNLGTELGGTTNLSLDQLKQERDPEE